MKKFNFKNVKLIHTKMLIGFVILSQSIFGLTSHIYSLREKRFIGSKIMSLYSFAVATTFTYIYGKDIYDDWRKHEIDLKNVTRLYTYMSIIATIVDYIAAFLLSNALVTFLNKVDLFSAMSFLDINKAIVKSSVMVVVLKALFFPLLTELTLVLRHLRNHPEQHALRTLYSLLPTVISNVMPNCFFGTLVICRLLINALNERLLNIVQEVNCMQTDLQMQLQKPYYRMQRFCDLADKMDVLAEKYAAICTQTLEYLQLMSVPFICSLLCNLFGITAGFFTQYLAVADTLINDESYDVFNALTNSIFLVISVSEIVMQANVCNDNTVAVRQTGIILQRITLLHTDVRFQQSVEEFSLSIMATKYKIQPLGLLEVDVSLVYDVISAVTSFLLILIQSDLTLRFSLK